MYYVARMSQTCRTLLRTAQIRADHYLVTCTDRTEWLVVLVSTGASSGQWHLLTPCPPSTDGAFECGSHHWTWALDAAGPFSMRGEAWGVILNGRAQPLPKEASGQYTAGSIAGNMRRFRLAQGLSFPEVAAALGVGAPYIGKLERGEKNPTTARVEELCELFGVTPNDLFEAPSE